jgi:hypothetical protein
LHVCHLVSKRLTIYIYMRGPSDKNNTHFHHLFFLIQLLQKTATLGDFVLKNDNPSTKELQRHPNELNANVMLL